MKVAHGTAWFLPDTYGGTEIYVASLARELLEMGAEQLILAPREKVSQPPESTHDGVPVVRYRIEGGPNDGEPFEEALKRAAPDIFHLHTWTSTAGLPELREAHRQDKGCVITFHTYAPICANETLMKYDREPCDGKIRNFACSTCYLHHRGRPLGVARLMAATMALFSEFQRRKDELAELAELADVIVAPAAFVRDALLRNRVEPSKIVLSRQGYAGREPVRRTRTDGALRIGIIGRIDELKGTDVIVDAVRMLPRSEAVELEVIGAVGGVAGTRRDPEAFLMRIKNAAASDPRIRLLGPMPHGDAMMHLAEFDLLAVPSRCQETGPLAAMEAIAHGVPVLGSNLGGLPETVGDGIHGRIMPSLDPRKWSEAILEIAHDRTVLDKWRGQKARTMADVAGEMLQIYQKISARP